MRGAGGGGLSRRIRRGVRLAAAVHMERMARANPQRGCKRGGASARRARNDAVNAMLDSRAVIEDTTAALESSDALVGAAAGARHAAPFICLVNVRTSSSLYAYALGLQAEFLNPDTSLHYISD